MGKPEESYQYVTVETYVADHTSGLHGKVHVRPVAGQGFSTSLRVRSPKEMRRDYPIGTQFRIYAKLTDREGGEPSYTRITTGHSKKSKDRSLVDPQHVRVIFPEFWRIPAPLPKRDGPRERAGTRRMAEDGAVLARALVPWASAGTVHAA
jgi:hypothetical protein